MKELRPLLATSTVTPAASPTPSDNDYTRINDAIQAAAPTDTIKLLGTFDWIEANAAASWALGSDGIASTVDDYSIYIPQGLNNVTLTADNLGDATIQGPGDLAGANLEGVLFFDGGINQAWTISNIRFLDFDLAIGMFYGTGPTDPFNNTTISNNYIRLASDLNATVAPADTNQNIGIHFSFGTNQVISGNTIDIQGNAVSDSGNGNFASDVGMQSNTSGGSVYDGLQITNNTIRVLNAQSAAPQVILGIWENGHAHTSDMTVSGNRFINQAAGNDPATNMQRAFRVTSHSSATTTVTYADNTISGANIGFQWIAGSNFTGNQPVALIRNTITDGATGILVQSQGLATLSYNRIAGNTTGLSNVDGTVTAENNWWGCNAGPGNTGCNPVSGTVDFDPWLTLMVDAAPATINAGGTSTITADMTYNSDAVDMSGSGTLPLTPITFSATQGTMAPPSGTITAGQATSTFTSTTTSSGNACATVDNQLSCISITVLSADLAITKTDGVTTATPGGSVTYTITASNAGPSNATGATITDTFHASLTATWVCVGADGGTCTASGSGNINDTVNLPAGGSVTYTATATISASATGTLANTARVSSSVTDPDPANNSATDTDTLHATAAPPVITEGASVAVAMSENGNPTPFALTLHATDANGDPLTWSILTPATTGTASVSATTGVVAYTPPSNYYGTTMFVVQVSDGDGGTDSITVNVTVVRRTFKVFLPLVVRPVTTTDLVVTSISLVPNKSTFAAGEPVEVRVTVTNQGSAAAGAFWVDLYINPSSPPTAANQIWNTRCALTPCFGMTWEVTGGLAAGQSITLSSRNLLAGYSVWPGYFAAGTSDLYAYADSYSPGVVDGAVVESDEANNRAELHGLTVTGPNPALREMGVGSWGLAVRPRK